MEIYKGSHGTEQLCNGRILLNDQFHKTNISVSTAPHKETNKTFHNYKAHIIRH